MPLRRRAASREQDEWILRIGRFRQRPRRIEKKAGATIGMEKSAIGEEATFGEVQSSKSEVRSFFSSEFGIRTSYFRERPLNPALRLDVRVIANSGKIARLAARK